jgi:O-antigen ligase
VTVLTRDEPATGHVGEPRKTGPSSWNRVDHVVMAGLLLAWAGPLTRGVGGRDPHDQLITLVVLAPGLLLLRAWRLRAGPLLAAAAVSIAALAVCVLSPTGWSGADVAGGYVLAAGFLVAALRYARTPERRDIVAGGVCLAGVYQFLAGVVPWVQGRDPSAVMTGTFYWHNPYAAFLLPGAVLGLAFAVRGSAPWRLVGWISAPLCTAGIVLSTSRATLAVLVVAWLMVVVPAIVDRRSALRAVGVSIASVVVTFAVTGPPFFPHFSSPFAATTARSKAGESLDSSGHYRTEFWRQALAVGAHHPLWGGGFHSLGTAAVLYTPDWWATTQLAHNGYLQAWTDGGLLLAVPFLVVLAVGAWWALRVTVPSRPGADRRRRCHSRRNGALRRRLRLVAPERHDRSRTARGRRVRRSTTAQPAREPVRRNCRARLRRRGDGGERGGTASVAARRAERLGVTGPDDLVGEQPVRRLPAGRRAVALRVHRHRHTDRRRIEASAEPDRA